MGMRLDYGIFTKPRSTAKLAVVMLALATAVMTAEIGFGVSTHFLRPLTTTVFVLFIPGLMLLPYLKAQLSVSERLIYSVGISMLVFIGASLLANSLAVLGITRPLSIFPFVFTGVMVLGLSVAALLKRNPAGHLDITEGDKIEGHHLPIVLLLVWLPILSILGARVVHGYGSNLILMLLLVLVAAVAVLMGFGVIPRRFYPLAILSISLALVYHTNLSTDLLGGRDVMIEYYYANLTNTSAFWDTSLPARINAMIGDSLLPPALSQLTGLSLSWVVKVIYGFLFGLIPLCLYRVFLRQVGPKVAIFSAFFFASYGFFHAGIADIKVMMAIYFLSLLVLTMTKNTTRSSSMTLLAVGFAFALITSHYATSYIFMISSFAVLLIVQWIRKTDHTRTRTTSRVIPFAFVALYVVLAFLWYTSVAAEDTFNVIVRLGTHIVDTIPELFAPVRDSGMYFMTTPLPSFEYDVLRTLLLSLQLFTAVGVLSEAYLVIRGTAKRHRMRDGYFLFSCVSLGWMVVALAVPNVIGDRSIGLVRLYFICLIFLAPWAIVGGVRILGAAVSLARKVFLLKPVWSDVGMRVLVCVLVVFVLLESKFVMEVRSTFSPSTGYANSLGISQGRILSGKSNPEELVNFYSSYVTPADYHGAAWLGQYKHEADRVLVDYSLVPEGYGPIPHNQVIEAGVKDAPIEYIKNTASTTYIYLRELNIKYGIMATTGTTYWGSVTEFPTLSNRSLIYSNGYCEIYR